MTFTWNSTAKCRSMLRNLPIYYEADKIKANVESDRNLYLSIQKQYCPYGLERDKKQIEASKKYRSNIFDNLLSRERDISKLN